MIASPKTMPDGTVFDAEYYAKTYPDVVSAIGTDENALYQHYVMAGKAEGRHPVAPVQTTESKSSANSSDIDKALSAIQSSLDTGTIPISAFGVRPVIACKFTTSENIDSYIEPILELMARNGYKYVVRTMSPNVVSLPFNGTCEVQSSEFLEKRYIYVSKTNHFTGNEKEVIKIYMDKPNKDYSVSIMGTTNSAKKNELYIDMIYCGPYDKDWCTVVREIPVN